jgi:chemotaxis protein MotB
VQTTPVRLLSRSQEEQDLEKVGGNIKEKLKDAGLTAIGDRIEIVKTSEGLRIELAEGGTGQEFFALASAIMTETMRRTLEIIAQELSPLRNPVIVEGHTDAAQFAGLYSNWELSADRANAARRTMEGAGLNRARVVEVRGMADRQLRNTNNPLDPRNRRITIMLPFTTPPSEEPPSAPTLPTPPRIPRNPGTTGT